jgi:dethiobiotin synthetase
VEGAGGLLVPLYRGYYNSDLIRELDCQAVIVSRLGLGTINHTLLTINQARAANIKVKGLLFSDQTGKRRTLAEHTNPGEISRLSGVQVLGTVPFLKTFTEKEVLSKCRDLAIG